MVTLGEVRATALAHAVSLAEKGILPHSRVLDTAKQYEKYLRGSIR